MANRRDVTTAEAVRAWLKIDPGSTAPVVEAHKAAEAHVATRTGSRWSYSDKLDPVTGDVVRDAWGVPVLVWDPDVEPPGDLVLAVMLLAHRYLARRNSPDGLAGLGDGLVGRVPISDRDADRLMGPWLPVIV